MNHLCRVKSFFLQLDNALEFRLSKIKETEDFFVTEISDKEKMSQTLNKYIAALDYPDKTYFVRCK